MASSVWGNLTVRYRLMANYRGAPYEAGIGPAEGAVVLFAACPPPEELGFEPATGHWRKELSIQDVQAMWQSRPVGTFRGETCIVLDDLGDRLHIGYLGHDAYRAEQLGYWQVDRGVFELVAPRDEVTNIIEERTDYQPAQAAPGGYPASAAPARTAPASYPAMPPQLDPGYGRPASQARPDYLLSPAAPQPDRMGPPDNGVALPPPTATPPLPLEAEAMRAASAASRRDQAAAPAGPGSPAGPAGLNSSPAAGSLPPSRSAAAGSMAPSAPVAPPASSGPPPLYAAPVPLAPAFPPSAPAHPGTQGHPGAQAHPGGQATPPGAAGASAMAAPGGESPRRRRSAGRRMATERIFGELASLAAIPVTSYSVGEEVDGAMCLLETGDGFEVFSSAGGARHEVRVFSDEESACFYLFGVLAADAVRTGGLVPSAGQGPPVASAGGRPPR
jgi:hypothetical protein